MRTKVCHLTSVHPANDNRIFHKECTFLAKEGYDVYLVAANAKTEIINNVKIIGVEIKKSGRLYRMTRVAWSIFRKCQKINADIYHFHDPELMIPGIFFKLFRKKVIYDIHENTSAAILSKSYLKSNLLTKILSKSIDIVEKILVRFYDLLITARPDISRRFKKFDPITLRNFPILSLNKIIFASDIKKNKFSVIYVGLISKIRGIIELINAFSYIDNAELWLLGRFETEKLRKECEMLPAWRNVRYFGIVEPNEVFSYLKLADIGIITFLDKPNHLKSLATKPFEYMACGLPMVMSDFPYWKKFFKNSSLYVDPLDSKEIANKIIKLLSNKILRKEMSHRNMCLAKNLYNWQTESIKLIDAYSKIKKIKL
jgi:glycosyltransferase involved in cell wall biosynthesis